MRLCSFKAAMQVIYPLLSLLASATLNSLCEVISTASIHAEAKQLPKVASRVDALGYSVWIEYVYSNKPIMPAFGSLNTIHTIAPV